MNQKLTLLLLTILFSIPLTTAGTTYNIDLSKPTQIITISERDAIKFNWNNKEHTIMIRKVINNKKTVDLTIFLENVDTPTYVSINPKRNIKIDFEKDGIKDLTIKLWNINNKQVTLLFEKPTNKNKITGQTIKEIKQEPPPIIPIILFTIIALTLILFLIIKRGEK